MAMRTNFVLRENVYAYSIMIVQVTHSNCILKFLCFPCLFPVLLQIFPVPIYMICDYYIHKHWHGNLIQL